MCRRSRRLVRPFALSRLREREGPAKRERLSGLSKGMSEFGPHIACFGIEADEEFAGKRDADLHFAEATSQEALAEVGEALIVSACDICDEEEDRAQTRSPAPDRAPPTSLSAVIGERRETDEFANGPNGDGADLRQLGRNGSCRPRLDGLHHRYMVAA